jgi:hypothetical protein
MAVGSATLKALQTFLYSVAFGCSAVILGTAKSDSQAIHDILLKLKCSSLLVLASRSGATGRTNTK